MSTETIIIISLLSATLVSIPISVFLILRKLNTIKDKVLDVNIDIIGIKDTIRDDVKPVLADIKFDSNEIKTTNKTHTDALRSLTSSIQSMLKQEIQKKQAKTYPTAQMMPEIDTFITDHILMAAFLISEQRIPDNPILFILEAVSKAYPQIDYNYLSERVCYIADQFNKSSTGKKAQ